MIVRSNRGFDLNLAAMVAGLMIGSLAAALRGTPQHVRCRGSNRWLCEGLNSGDLVVAGVSAPWLAMTALMAVLLTFVVLRLWSGWTVQLRDGQLWIASLFRTARMPVSDVQSIGVWPGAFRISSRIDVYTRDGRRIIAANSNPDDAESLAEQLRPRLPPR